MEEEADLTLDDFAMVPETDQDNFQSLKDEDEYIDDYGVEYIEQINGNLD